MFDVTGRFIEDAQASLILTGAAYRPAEGARQGSGDEVRPLDGKAVVVVPLARVITGQRWLFSAQVRAYDRDVRATFHAGHAGPRTRKW
jgi:hypothetical protein